MPHIPSIEVVRGGATRVAHGAGEVVEMPSAMREAYRTGKEACLPEDVARTLHKQLPMLLHVFSFFLSTT